MNKKILILDCIAIFLLLITPNISAIQNILIKDTIEQNLQEIYTQKTELKEKIKQSINNTLENKIIYIKSFFKNENISKLDFWKFVFLYLFLIMTLFYIAFHTMSVFDFYVTYGSIYTKNTWDMVHFLLPLSIGADLYLLFPDLINQLTETYGEEFTILLAISIYCLIIEISDLTPAYRKLLNNNPLRKTLYFFGFSVRGIFYLIFYIYLLKNLPHETSIKIGY